MSSLAEAWEPPHLFTGAGPDRDADPLVHLLEDALLRQEGPDLVRRVAEVRSMRTGADVRPEALAAYLADVDVPGAIGLVRSFTTWLHLANVKEQVAGDLAMSGTADGPGAFLADTVDRIIAADADPTVLAAVVEHLELRPVFTAHPPSRSARRCWPPCATWPRSCVSAPA